MKISRIDPSDGRFAGFEQFSSNHPQANFFQSGIFYRFIDGIDNYEPLLLICEDEKDRIRGSLLAVIQRENNKLLRRLSSGTITRGGPLVDDSEDHRLVLHSLVKQLTDLTSGETLFTEFRNFSSQDENMPVFRELGYAFRDHQNLVTPTKTREDAWNGLHKNRKRQITQSLKNGATVNTGPTTEEYRQFYDILKDLYRTRIHKPLPSWTFFERFYSQVKGSSHGIVLVVRSGDRVIGGILCPASGSRALHEWYVCGLDREYSKQGIYPSVLATWGAIEYAALHNFTAFDFLGLGSPGKHYGVRDFKLKFGGELVNHGRFFRINNHPLYLIATTGLFILKKLSPLFRGS